jgi:hypothetical protein
MEGIAQSREMIDEMNTKMNDCRTKQMIDRKAGRTIRCSAKYRIVGKPVRSDVGTLEYWNVDKNLRFARHILKQTNNGINSRMYNYINK